MAAFYSVFMLSSSRRLLYPLVMLLVATPPLLSSRLARPAPNPGDRDDPVGLTLGEKRGRSIVITSLMNGGAAARAGVAVGDEVDAVDHRPVTAVGMARRLIDDPARCDLALDLRRGHAPLVATLHYCG
ncbi:PDZ domain-containing protein [Sphingobium aromaticiconvertens]|uniref:PDZ domain-containing protein n=1 Tax=Sphingobium aromaticiconvertens TaxID=365341 RepID=UPI00301B0DFD